MLINSPLKIQDLLKAGVEISANHLLELDEQAQSKLVDLEGKVIAVFVEGFELEYFIMINNRSLCVFDAYQGKADVSIAGLPSALLKLAMQDNIMMLMQSGQITMQGDVKLGQKLKHILSLSSVDWEELVSKLTGDIPAYQLGRWFKKTSKNLRRVHQSLNSNISEYLQEELRHLPTNIEVENFMRDVDTLRNDSERLFERLQHIKNALVS